MSFFFIDTLFYWPFAWLVWNPLTFRSVVHGPVLDWKQFLAVGMLLATIDNSLQAIGTKPWHRSAKDVAKIQRRERELN